MKSLFQQKFERIKNQKEIKMGYSLFLVGKTQLGIHE